MNQRSVRYSYRIQKGLNPFQWVIIGCLAFRGSFSDHVPMRFKYSLCFLILAIIVGALTGCRGPSLSQRIDGARADFEMWPAEVQALVSKGDIAVGFTPDQVRMAWGEPDERGMEITAEEETERWIYRKKTPAFGIGLGFGHYGGGGGVGGGIGTTIGGDSNVIAIVRYKNGVVDSFDRKK